MTARKQLKRQRQLERDQQRRASERAQVQRRFLTLGVVAVVVLSALVLAFAFSPWSGSSGEADETLPALSLTIGDNFFQPEELTIQAGQKYRLNLVNKGSATHDFWAAGSDGKTSTGDDVRSDPIPGGGSATVKIQYQNPGTYYFVCTFHAGQGGTLIVQ